MHYRRKPYKVEALRWKPDLAGDEIPYWLFHPLKRHKSTLTGQLFQVGSKLHVKTADGLKIASEGDWVLYSSLMGLDVCSNEDFEKFYEFDERAAKIRSTAEEARKDRESFKKLRTINFKDKLGSNS